MGYEDNGELGMFVAFKVYEQATWNKKIDFDLIVPNKQGMFNYNITNPRVLMKIQGVYLDPY